MLMKAGVISSALVGMMVCSISTTLAAAPTIGPTTITPVSIAASTATTVTVQAIIADASLLPGSVNLQRLDVTSNVFRNIGMLQDDGTRSGRFTIQLNFSESAPLEISLRVSAAFRGILARVFSSVLTLKVT